MMKLGICASVFSDELSNMNEESVVNMIQTVKDLVSRYNLQAFELAYWEAWSHEEFISIIGPIVKALEGIDLSMHLPFVEVSPTYMIEGLRKESLIELNKHLDICRKFGIKKAVLHPGVFKLPFYMAEKERLNKILLDSLSKLNSNNIEIYLENMPKGYFLYTSPEEFEKPMCLDTGHAVTNSLDPCDFISKAGHIHLIDNHNDDNDRHLVLGTGDLDVESLFNKLRKKEFKGNVVLESISVDDAIKSLDYLKKLKII